jgi:hypothetical protein
VVEEGQMNSAGVWDATQKKLRLRTASEQLEAIKPARLRAMQHKADQELGKLFPVTGQYNSVARRRPNDPRVGQADAVMDRLDQLTTAISNAQNQAALDAISWEV